MIPALLCLFSASCVDLLNPPDEYYYNVDSRSQNSSFSAPTGFNAWQASETEAELKWNKVTGAIGYIVEYALGEDGDYEEVYKGHNTFYTHQISDPGAYKHFFRVTAYNSSESACTEPRSVKFQAVIMNASEHEYLPGEEANDNGVYPVKIKWKMPYIDGIAYVKIQRSENSGSGFSTVETVAISSIFEDSDNFFSYTDRNATARVGKKYNYRISFLNNSSQELLISEEIIGWGALTHERYMVEYNKIMNTALGKLDYMYRTPDTSKLGTENPGPKGDISGNIYYSAGTVGFLGTGGAEIFIQLTNYCDFYIENDPSKGAYFVLNGNSDTKSSMLAAGNMRGTMSITGMYPGIVVYGTAWSTTVNASAGITIGSGKANGGNYMITPNGVVSNGEVITNGFPSKPVKWNFDYPTAVEYPNEPGIFMATRGYNAQSAGHLPW